MNVYQEHEKTIEKMLRKQASRERRSQWLDKPRFSVIETISVAIIKEPPSCRVTLCRFCNAWRVAKGSRESSRADSDKLF
jgi:hypothetical protein